MNESTTNILTSYKADIEEILGSLEIFTRQERKFSLLRLITAIIGVTIAILVFQQHILMGIGWVVLIGLSFFFIYLKHEKAKNEIALCHTLITIKQNEIDAITNHINIFPDGKKYCDPSHDFAEDLDIFGEKSLFNLINRCSSQWGNDHLATIFTQLPEMNDIVERQEAIVELSRLGNWRDLFIARMLMIESKDDANLLERIQSLTSQNYAFIQAPGIRLGRWLVPAFWVICLILYLLSIPFAGTITLAGAIIIFSIYLWYSPKVNEIQHSISTGKNYIDDYLGIFSSIYDHPWKSQLLQSLVKKEKGSLQIEALNSLNKIIDKLDYRLNMIVGFTLNLTVFWDFIIINRLKNWADEYEKDIPDLFHVLGKIEALTSLSIWKYNHPGLPFAEISDNISYIMSDIRHPLMLEGQCVPNNFLIRPEDYVSVITGSNMSGKSTILRTIGINMVLAYSGTVVDASEFKVPLVRIITYMRIKDALEESVSTFKAELNRVKLILDSLDDEKRCLYLIDEMLRGTNSKDKLKGSIAITKKILAEKAYTIIATHDIQLAELGHDYPDHINNYYFDIEFQGEDLVFDYKLKEGICSNFNASHLLKQIGVE